MTASKERITFITLFRDQYPEKAREECVRAAGLLLRYAKQHGNLAVDQCNGPPEWTWRNRSAEGARKAQGEWQANLEKRQERLDAKIKALCTEWNLPVKLGGDPRGYTVRVMFPKDARGIRPSNIFGGQEDGWGVPS